MPLLFITTTDVYKDSVSFLKDTFFQMETGMGRDTEKNCPDMQKNALFLYQDGGEHFHHLSSLWIFFFRINYTLKN